MVIGTVMLISKTILSNFTRKIPHFGRGCLAFVFVFFVCVLLKPRQLFKLLVTLLLILGLWYSLIAA